MAMLEKTVMEWLGEKKLYDKKIIKALQEIKETPLFVGKPKLYSNEKEMEEQMDKAKSLVDSYKKMVANRDKIQEEIMKFNAIHTIKISDKELTIAAALRMYQNYDDQLAVIMINNLNKVANLKEKLEKKQEEEVKSLEIQLNSANKQTGKQEFADKLKARKDDYQPVIKHAFDLIAEIDKEKTFKEEFLQNVNTQINILNVKETLSIDLDD